MSGFFAHQLSLGRKYSILAEVCCDAKRPKSAKTDKWPFWCKNCDLYQKTGHFSQKSAQYAPKCNAISYKTQGKMVLNATQNAAKRAFYAA